MRVLALIQTEHVHALRPGFGPNTCVRLPPIRGENVGVRVERTMTSMRERWIDDDDVYVKDCEAMVGFQEVRGVTVSLAGQRGPPPIP